MAFLKLSAMAEVSARSRQQRGGGMDVWVDSVLEFERICVVGIRERSVEGFKAVVCLLGCSAAVGKRISGPLGTGIDGRAQP
jgi:hypothetical protein